jgi:hypothetical protein
MCKLCSRAKNIDGYAKFIESMHQADIERMDFSKEVAPDLRPITKTIYSSMKWPTKFLYPMFDARAAFSVPHNYYQPLTLGSERLGNAFAHGAMRSVFFVGSRLVLLSKTVNHKAGREFFTSFVLAHFEPGEFNLSINGEEASIDVDIEKPMRNLITNKVEKKRISFHFAHKSIKGRIVSREQVMTSSQFKNIYKRYGGAMSKVSSIDMEGYAITVPHFAPHPYMLQLNQDFGYGSNRDFQERVLDYFKEHK